MAFESKLLNKTKKAYAGYYSANEVARNAQINPTLLDSEWYDLQPVALAPPKKPIIRINDEWGYVPVDLDMPVTAAVKQAWEDEHFTYWGLDFDVDKAEKIIAAHPREARVAPKQFLENFVGTTEVGESMEEPELKPGESIQIDLLSVGINKKRLKEVDITKPGIVAVAKHKGNPKRNQAELPMSILIDGNHRAKRALIEGKEFKVYVLTPEESWEIMQNTPPVLLKGLVKPEGVKPKKPLKMKFKAQSSLLKKAEPAKQEFTSERTSMNQLPAVFNKVKWQPKTVNLDYGGGKYNQAVDFLKSKNVVNLVFDPYNRAAEHNKDIMHKLKKRKADTATIANVLNVIKEPEIRKQVMRKVRGLVKPGGFVYIMVYRGEGTCPGPTCNGWQENRPLKTYLEEVQSVFGDAQLQGPMIVAKV